MATTQGIASLTNTELASLEKIYQAGGSSDAATVADSIITEAQKALGVKPMASATVVTSGSAVQTGQTANTGTVYTQSGDAYSLALAYELTGNSSYYNQAKTFLLDWAKTNVANSDPIANAAFMQMFQAYDLLRSHFSSSDQSTVDKWMNSIAGDLIGGQAQAAKDGSVTAFNNHNSWALLEVATIGVTLNNSTYIQYAANNFLNQIGNNLKSIPGEPPYLGVDYDERKAYHYVAYNLEALTQLAVMMDRLSHLPGNPYGITYNPFTVQVNGASIQHTLDALLPYASGEKTSTHEFQGSTDLNDAARLANGSLSSTFHPSDAIPALEAADYFGHTVNDPLTGHSYNLAQLTASILSNEGKLSLPSALPAYAFLQNDVESPYDATASAPSPAPATIKVATDNGTHTLDGSPGNVAFEFYKNTGQTTIQHFSGQDVLHIESKIYASAADALNHVQYSNGNAILHLDGNSTVTLTGVTSHSLTAADFHIF